VTRVALTTLGCKVNQYETAEIEAGLVARGFTIVPFNDEADIYIINTCTVTHRTDYQSRQLIRRAHRANPSAVIVATGCYAQTAPERLAELPGVTLVVGTEAKGDIPRMLEEMTAVSPGVIISDTACIQAFSSVPLAHFPGHTRAFLKIQDGCCAFCSYCIIPYARGKSRSLAQDSVIAQIERFSTAGFREVVLTGIHLGLYGHDLSPRTDIVQLLGRIEELGCIDRLRISSIEPMEITEGLITLMAESTMVCRHLHIPLQSGDDGILASMGRHYTTGQFRAVIETLRTAVPEIAIGMDVMVGFPGEGEREFTTTRDFLEGLPIAYLHVFPYSKRPGTAAAGFPGHVDERVKKERAGELRALGRRKRIAFNETFIGRNLSVLIEEKRDRTTGLCRGFSDNYIPVLIEDGNRFQSNTIVDIRAYGTCDESLMGRGLDHA